MIAQVGQLKCLYAQKMPQAETERINRPQNSMFVRDLSLNGQERKGYSERIYNGGSEKVGEVTIPHEQKSCLCRALRNWWLNL